MELVKGGVLNEEMRRRSQGSSTQYEVLFTKKRGRDKHKGKNGRDKSRSKSRFRYKNVECHRCGKKGHIKKFCYQWKRKNKASSEKQDQKDHDNNNRVNAMTTDDLLVVHDDDVITFTSYETN